MRRPPKREIEIDVVPYLDSMVITLNLICLIIIIMIIPVIMNPDQVNVLSFEKLKRSKESEVKETPIPIYLDCSKAGVRIMPADISVTPGQLIQPGNDVERVLTRVQAQPDKEYVIMLVRPGSLPVYRYLRKELIRRRITTGFDVVDSETELDWEGEMKMLNIKVEQLQL
jgi:hypothetical protein